MGMGILWSAGYGQLYKYKSTETSKKCNIKVYFLKINYYYFLFLSKLNIISIALGVAHSLFLQANGVVLGCGHLGNGELGFDPTTCKSHKYVNCLKAFCLFKVPIPGPVRLIASSYFHGLAVSEKLIYMWGENPQTLKMKIFLLKRLKNQNKEEKFTDSKATNNLDSLAISNTIKSKELSRDYMKVHKLCDWKDSEILQISAGFNHSAFITNNGQLYTFGKNLEMQLGLGDKKDRSQPILVEMELTKEVKWTKVICGKYFY